MNTERLHAVVRDLVDDFNETNLIGRLLQLVSFMEQGMRHNSHSNFEAQLEDKAGELQEALSDSATNQFSPTWREIVDEIGGTPFLANNIQAELDLIFRRPVAVGVKYQEVKLIHERVKPYIDSLSGLCDAMRGLSISQERLSEGDSEVGIVVPRASVDNSLGDFGKELTHLNRMLGVFSEMTTDSRENFEIKTISSSELTVFIEMAAPALACLAVAIERILALYKNILDIQKLQLELKEKQAPKSVVQGMEKYSSGQLENGLEEIVDDLLVKYNNSSNTARKNELKVELKSAVRKLAKRIDEGYLLDIRIEPYVGDDSEEPSPEVDTILTASKNILYPSIGDKRVLNLPDTED